MKIRIHSAFSFAIAYYASHFPATSCGFDSLLLLSL